MSLSECLVCGGHIPLGTHASNRCEKCGAGVFDGGEHNVDIPSEVSELYQLRKDHHNLRGGLYQQLGPALVNNKGFWDATDLDLIHGIELRLMRLTMQCNRQADTIAKWEQIAQERPSDNMIYHAPTIQAILKDLKGEA